MTKKFLCLMLTVLIALIPAALADANYLTVSPIEEATFAGQTDGQNWVHVLLLGMDNRDTDDYSRSDCMLMVSLNKKTHKVKLTSFLRDTWVDIPGHGKNKLNAACRFGGPELAMETLNRTYDLDLKYYASVNLSCMADIIDVLGGVRIDVTEEERKALNKGLFDLSSRSGMEQLEESGEQVLLNGNQAVAFARIRHIDTDYKRTERQRTVLLTIAGMMKEASALKLGGIVASVLPYVKTNLTMSEILSLASTGLKSDLSTVEQQQIPQEGTFKSGTFNGVWCIKPDFKKNTRILYEYLFG